MSTPPLTERLADGVLRIPVLFVNVYALGRPGQPWIMVDTGLTGASTYLKHTAETYMQRPPEAIVLTHGHFDHAGNAAALAKAWSVPIYAHTAELPFLTGRSDYPPADSSMGGAIAQLARPFPNSGFDFGDRVQALPDNGTVPGAEGWGWIHTPGHTPGHVSLWRPEDKTLIAGDAFATMDLDSYAAQVTHARELSRSPVPFTPDWDAAQASVEALANLEPHTIGAGHGSGMSAPTLSADLYAFAKTRQRPTNGRYAQEPAQFDAQVGLVSVPPPVEDPALGRLLAGMALLAIGAWSLNRLRR